MAEYIKFLKVKPFDFSSLEQKHFSEAVNATSHLLTISNIEISVHYPYNDRVVTLYYTIDGKHSTIKRTVTSASLSYLGYKESIDQLVNDLATDLMNAIDSPGILSTVADRIHKMLTKISGHTQQYVLNNKMHDDEEIQKKATKLPGIRKFVDYPCGCMKGTSPVFTVIIHLNDYCKWSREKIADWIDDLHDKGIINAEFDPWEEDQKVEEPPSVDDFQKFKAATYQKVELPKTGIVDINPA